MKLRVKVEGKSYDVEVEVIDPLAEGGAASRVEGSPLGSVPRPASMGGGGGALGKGGAAGPARAPVDAGVKAGAQAAPKVPAVLAAPWHGLSVGPAGVVAAPAPGTITRVMVKVGDAVRVGDAIAEFQMSSVVAPQEKAAVGTIRVAESGLVAEVLVAAGTKVGFGQALVRLAARA